MRRASLLVLVSYGLHDLKKASVTIGALLATSSSIELSRS